MLALPYRQRFVVTPLLGYPKAWFWEDEDLSERVQDDWRVRMVAATARTKRRQVDDGRSGVRHLAKAVALCASLPAWSATKSAPGGTVGALLFRRICEPIGRW